MLVIRADGNSKIGSGHIMRCSAIAAEAVARGESVLFAVSDDEGASLVSQLGYAAKVMGGSCSNYSEIDANDLGHIAQEVGARALLVDSYAVNDSFFDRLTNYGLPCTYFDDLYIFNFGKLGVPKRWDVSAVVNYGYGADMEVYGSVYGGSDTALLIGPSFAPVRDAFHEVSYVVRSDVQEILITCGMTNPERTLERMVAGCREALPTARLSVVVGKMASFDESCLEGCANEVIYSADDMVALMRRADIAVSAAGTTLYELACVGVPIVAVPIVENQIANAQGIEKLNIGTSIVRVQWTANDIASAIAPVAKSYSLREEFSSNARGLVDGYGARRIYERISSTTI